MFLHADNEDCAHEMIFGINEMSKFINEVYQEEQQYTRVYAFSTKTVFCNRAKIIEYENQSILKYATGFHVGPTWAKPCGNYMGLEFGKNQPTFIFPKNNFNTFLHK